VTGPPEERKPKDPSTWIGKTSDRVRSLSDYFLAGTARYTPEALRQAASESGYSPEEIDEAYSRATRRQRDEEVTAPIRRRALWIVLAAYALAYTALGVALLGTDNRYGAATIALGVLTFVLGIALLISINWVRGRRPSAGQLQGAMLTMLSLPFVLLVSVAGLCIATTRPFGP
jgi:hypothetical protein